MSKLLALAPAQMMATSQINVTGSVFPVVRATPKTKEELNRERGLTHYEFYEGDKVIFSCWARNQKNADRKFNNFKKSRKE